MPKPIPGKYYTAVKGDNLSIIANRAYGLKSKWKDIKQANPDIKDPNKIKIGQEIFIPGDNLIPIPSVAGKGKNDFTLKINEVEIPVASARVVKTMDTFADGWSATLPFDDQNIDKFKLYSKAEVFLGDKKIITGRLYERHTNISSDKSSLNIAGWSYTADLIDSSVRPPFQATNITLEKRAKQLIEPLGFTVNFNSSDKKKFKRLKIGKTEKIFDHLNKLAVQRGILISSDEDGQPLFTEPNTSGSIGTIEQGSSTLPTISMKQNGRDRFSVYKVYGKGPRKRLNASAQDKNIPASRMMTYVANDSDGKDLQAAANYRRNLALAKMLKLELPVVGWYGPDGNLWKENTLVTVIASGLFLPDGYTFLIKQVTYNFTTQGITATLHLVPPSVYTKEDIDDPWKI